MHGGGSVALVLRSAPAGTGVVFRAGGSGEIPARAQAVSATTHATTLSHGKDSVSTVEHLLASLHARQIDNVQIELDGAEVPIMDGSALPFVQLLRHAGVRRQSALRPQLRIVRPLEVVDGERRIAVEPGEGLTLSCTIDFAHPAIGRQSMTIESLTAEVFEREIAPARTFGFLEDADALRQAGLAQGASLENTVVLDERGVVNPDGLRWPDEFVRHKLLDLIGDLSLLGHPIHGCIRVERGGHALHHRFVRALLESPESWRVEGSDRESTPTDPGQSS